MVGEAAALCTSVPIIIIVIIRLNQSIWVEMVRIAPAFANVRFDPMLTRTALTLLVVPLVVNCLG